MTIWQPDLSHHSGPRYQAIADAISAAVAAGELAPGTRLPPQRDLAWKLKVTVGTVSRAYMLAEQRGLVSGEIGRGTFVREAGPVDSSSDVVPDTDSSIVDLTRNAAGSAAHAAALRATLERLSARGGLERLLGYMPDAGHRQHRALGARWIGQAGLQCSAENVVLTGGAQQAIVAALGALVDPGTPVLCDELTYCGLMEAARLLRLKLHGVAMDAGGMNPEALDRAAHETGARSLFVIPTIHNPTAITMDTARRRQIAEVARRRDLLVFEDDVYGLLPPKRPQTIASLIPERTAYIASVSKSLAPGLRVGWIAAPPALTPRLADALHALCISPPALPAEILRQWIEDGTAGDLTRHLRDDIRSRQTLAAEILAGLSFAADPYAFHILLHLPEPWRREDYVSAARAAGIAVVPASVFAVGRTPAPHAVRISLAAAANHTVLRQALERLADLARSGPSARRTVI